MDVVQLLHKSHHHDLCPNVLGRKMPAWIDLATGSSDTMRAISGELVLVSADSAVCYSVYSELVDFRKKRENLVHFGGQECRPKRRCPVFSI